MQGCPQTRDITYTSVSPKSRRIILPRVSALAKGCSRVAQTYLASRPKGVEVSYLGGTRQRAHPRAVLFRKAWVTGLANYGKTQRMGTRQSSQPCPRVERSKSIEPSRANGRVKAWSPAQPVGLKCRESDMRTKRGVGMDVLPDTTFSLPPSKHPQGSRRALHLKP